VRGRVEAHALTAFPFLWRAGAVLEEEAEEMHMQGHVQGQAVTKILKYMHETDIIEQEKHSRRMSSALSSASRTSKTSSSSMPRSVISHSHSNSRN
jgi:hypothetical protein